MRKPFRFVCAAFLVGILLSAGVHGLSSYVSGSVTKASFFAQASQPAATQGTQPSDQPATSDPRLSVKSFFEAVELGDMDIVLHLTGVKQGKAVTVWCSKGLKAFVGHTDFWPLTTVKGLPSNASGVVECTWPPINPQKPRMILTYNNNKKACVHVDSFMRFLDPGALPSTRNICHFYIDGNFKLEAMGGEWIITSLPNFQEARNDSPWKWGSSPYVYPYPGDPLGPYRYTPGHEPLDP